MRTRTGGAGSGLEEQRSVVVDNPFLPRELPTLVASDKWLGPYRLCLMLASGGMGSVYLARPAGGGLRRFVAVKRLRPQFVADPAFRSMLLDEARIASQLRHPNVCQVYDCSISDEACYIVMEYLQGEPLSRVRHALGRDRALRARSAPLIARVVADACEGLHAAHELRDASGTPLGVVHRDVSLDNLFLTYDGVVKVVDFGIASDGEQTHRTQTGILKGKLAYMAPEVLLGRKPDRRADVWGLGVAFWELLTARRLFRRASDAETLHRVVYGKIPTPSSVRPDVPAELDAIVMRALARNPDERFPTARSMSQSLSLFLADRRLAVGLAQLADWMDELFVEGRAHQRELLDVAARLEDVDEVQDARAPVRAETTPSTILRTAGVGAKATAARALRGSSANRAWLAVGITIGLTELAVGWMWWRARDAGPSSRASPAAAMRRDPRRGEAAAVQAAELPVVDTDPLGDPRGALQVLEVLPSPGSDAGVVMLCFRPEADPQDPSPVCETRGEPWPRPGP